ncbi:uncharacterized protein [Miscanthus floridulus]|uniref:uncharacterized protein n=1 Tax=Miscanthus floridulus TaxID=154761 RepID=UPI00345885F1
MLMPRIHKLSFPTYDGKEDPLPWINRCEQFFRGQKTRRTIKSGQGGDDWAYFARCVNERFGPPTWRNPLGELASLRKTTTIDDYIERFPVHIAWADTLDE